MELQDALCQTRQADAPPGAKGGAVSARTIRRALDRSAVPADDLDTGAECLVRKPGDDATYDVFASIVLEALLDPEWKEGVGAKIRPRRLIASMLIAKLGEDRHHSGVEFQIVVEPASYFAQLPQVLYWTRTV